MKRERGSTLLELIVTLAIMSIVFGVVALALSRRQTPVDDWRAQVAAAREQALRTRARVTAEIATANGRGALTAFPDGTVIGDSALGVDRLSGEIARAH
ncbi:MAG TPA: type II secretion system protein [Gemmatimonadaceae bacterium]|nr:type II secretion system protein [Gemmatimonadaceae bacterium]